MTQEEAARAMGCPLGTVRSWLARGRALLHKRLSRAGLTLSAAGFTALLAASTASARVPAVLLHTTLDSAARLAESGATTGMSASVAALVKGGQAALAGTRMKCLFALVLTQGTLAAGAVGYPLLAQVGRGKEAAPPTPRRVDELPPPPPAARNEGRADAEGDPLPADAVARLGARHFRHDAWVLDAALSPDGRTLATAAGNCVWLWDATNGRPAGRVLEHDNMVSVVAWSPDGKLLASGGWYDNSIRLWDPATRREIRRLKGHTGGELRQRAVCWI